MFKKIDDFVFLCCHYIYHIHSYLISPVVVGDLSGHLMTDPNLIKSLDWNGSIMTD